MEIKTNEMGRAKAVHSEVGIPRESATITRVLAETQRQAEEWESFIVEKGCALIGSCLHGEAGGRITRSLAVYVICWQGHNTAFSGWSYVVRQENNWVVVSY